MDNNEDLDEEMLIALVRQHRELYDCTLPKYSDVVRKEKIWNEIAEQISQPVHKCRERWSNLRGSFRRAYRDHKGINDNKLRKRSKRWKYEKQMEFLIPFLKIKYDPSSTDSREPRDFNLLPVAETSNPNDEICIKNETSSSPRSYDVDYPDTYSQTSAMDGMRVANAIGMTYDPFNNTNSHHPYKIDRENDALRNFFAYLAETVRTFPPFMQVLAKSKCFNIISEMEISLVKENPDQCVVSQISVDENVRETPIVLDDADAGNDTSDGDAKASDTAH